MGIHEIRILIVVSMELCLTSAVHAAQGNAVFYTSTNTPACSKEQNKGTMVTGVSDELWGNGAACGSIHRVQCIRGANKAPHPCHDGASVEVTVVDYCRPPCNGVLNLYQDAFG
ncbi:hypothetical protein Ddye_006443 [Dipteronia dyeriana]|uniref:Expansin-like EG45 domain-containing protein n=1 Tax=Dipteronia dyeriana TaxID=168575 RepID=A0AAD9XI25_9ROSI|nr:hypothetical protein Ddye_006443 [Dipteronia dyeriana]